MSLTIGSRYSRKDIYHIFSVPPQQQRGNWNTGYNQFNGDWFIFTNVNTKGRTGHDYDNEFIGADLLWYGKNGKKLSNPSSQALINIDNITFIFAREDSNDPYFYYLGNGRAKEVYDTVPIKILWTFDNPFEFHPERLPEEIISPEVLVEGAMMKITINTYERNPIARQRCLDHFGYSCSVCTFDFYEKYGDIGKKFAHVHHLRLLNEIGVEYEINPIKDLRPVCPNCHAMLHKRDPIYSIEELQQLLRIRSIQPATWDD